MHQKRAQCIGQSHAHARNHDESQRKAEQRHPITQPKDGHFRSPGITAMLEGFVRDGKRLGIRFLGSASWSPRRETRT